MKLSDLVDKKAETRSRMKTEAVLFYMPRDTELFLAALAAVEAYDYLRDLENTYATVHGGMISEYVIYLMAPEMYLPFIDTSRFTVLHGVFDRSFPLDVEVHMDVDRATNLACTTKRSLVEGFALMIGGDLRTIFPTMVATPGIQSNKILLLDRCSVWAEKSWDELHKLMISNFGDFEIVLESSSWADPVATIGTYAAVIGVRSATTYLAAAKKKMVIELSTGAYPNWLGKFEDPYYTMIFDERNTLRYMTPTLVYSVFALKAERIRLRRMCGLS